MIWIDGDVLRGELRSDQPFLHRYELVEENHHFHKEGEKYFRISQVYQLTIDRETEAVVEKKLILDNHSEVLYDYALIPAEQIR